MHESDPNRTLLVGGSDVGSRYQLAYRADAARGQLAFGQKTTRNRTGDTAVSRANVHNRQLPAPGRMVRVQASWRLDLDGCSRAIRSEPHGASKSRGPFARFGKHFAAYYRAS